MTVFIWYFQIFSNLYGVAKTLRLFLLRMTAHCWIIFRFLFSLAEGLTEFKSSDESTIMAADRLHLNHRDDWRLKKRKLDSQQQSFIFSLLIWI